MDNINILLVDDNQDCLRLVKSLLENEGMTVLCAETGEDALCALREKSFCLMITDLNLPGLDGFALAQKAMEIAPSMPVIMATGNSLPGTARLAKEVGIAMIIFKPFHPNEILAVIRNLLGVIESSL